MRKKLIGNVTPKCEYCKFGTASPGNSNVLCLKMGVLDKDFSCKKFVYDVLKREPRQMPKMMDFDTKDFEL